MIIQQIKSKADWHFSCILRIFLLTLLKKKWNPILKNSNLEGVIIRLLFNVTSILLFYIINTYTVQSLLDAQFCVSDLFLALDAAEPRQLLFVLGWPNQRLLQLVNLRSS